MNETIGELETKLEADLRELFRQLRSTWQGRALLWLARRFRAGRQFINSWDTSKGNH